MDRSKTFRPERGRPVPVDWPAAQLVVLRFVSETGWRKRRKPDVDATDRRAVPEASVLWQPQDGLRVGCQSQTCATTNP